MNTPSTTNKKRARGPPTSPPSQHTDEIRSSISSPLPSSVQRDQLLGLQRNRGSADKRFHLETIGRDPETGNQVAQEMSLHAAEGYSLPGGAERELFLKVILRIAKTRGFDQGGRIKFYLREACDLMGVKRSGTKYRQIERSLETLAMMGMKLKFAVVDGSTKQRRLLKVVDHLCSVEIYSEKDQTASARTGNEYDLERGQVALKFADWFVKNYLGRYTKPFDLGVYDALPRRAGIAKELLCYLHRTAYHRPTKKFRGEVRIPMADIAKRLRLSAASRKKIAEELRRAHKHLLQHWDELSHADVFLHPRGVYECIYRFDSQLPLPLATKTRPRKKQVARRQELVDSLVKRGMAEAQATVDVGQCDAETIRATIAYFDTRVANGLRFKEGPGAWLHAAIVGGYASAAREQVFPRERSRPKGVEEALESVNKQIAANRSKSPRERADSRFEFWLELRTRVDKRVPSQDERDRVYHGFLAEEETRSGC